MLLFATLISCASLLLPAVARTSPSTSEPQGEFAWASSVVFSGDAIIQCPPAHHDRSNPLVKNAHDPALAEEEDSTDPNHDQCLSQAVIQVDTQFTLDTSAPRISSITRPHSPTSPLALRC